MNIKVNATEWEQLKKDVEKLKEMEANEIRRHNLLMERVGEYIENFFDNKVHTYIIKRDREEIIAEIKEQTIKNLFKEKE